MTTAHRPQLEAALGKSNLAGHPASHHQRAGNLPQFYYLKKRVAKKLEREELKRQLVEAEAKASGRAVGPYAEEDVASGEKRKLASADTASSEDDRVEPTTKRLKSATAENVSSSESEDSEKDDEKAPESRKDASDDSASSDSDSNSDLDTEEQERKAWIEAVKAKYKDADKASSTEDDSDSEDSDESDDGSGKRDDEDALQRELNRVRAEREAQRRKEEEAQAAEEEEKRTVDIARGNPLLNPPEYTVKKKWYEDAVFKNQAKGPDAKKRQNEFINDLLRSDFNKRFMKKYIR